MRKAIGDDPRQLSLELGHLRQQRASRGPLVYPRDRRTVDDELHYCHSSSVV
jgi:hypothetical protein